MTNFLVGGSSDDNGITFSSNNYQIEVKTFPKIEIGDVKPIEKGKDFKVGIRFPALVIILSIFEIFHKSAPLQIGNLIIGISYVFRMIIIFYLVISIIFITYRSGIKGIGHLRMNHGAEHKVIEAYNNGRIENANKFEIFSKGCGSNVVLPILVFMLLGDWIFYPFTLTLFYYIGYLYVQPVRDILYKIICKPLQHLVTKEPVPDVLNAAKDGLSKLIYEEEVRLTANWCSKRVEMK